MIKEELAYKREILTLKEFIYALREENLALKETIKTQKALIDRPCPKCEEQRWWAEREPVR